MTKSHENKTLEENNILELINEMEVEQCRLFQESHKQMCESIELSKRVKKERYKLYPEGAEMCHYIEKSPSYKSNSIDLKFLVQLMKDSYVYYKRDIDGVNPEYIKIYIFTAENLGQLFLLTKIYYNELTPNAKSYFRAIINPNRFHLFDEAFTNSTAICHSD